MQSDTPVLKKKSYLTYFLTNFKKMLIGFLLLAFLWLLYGFATRAMKTYFGGPAPAPQVPKDFDVNDLVHFQPLFGQVTEIHSDRTLDAMLNGKFGPVVVLVYAEWCSHCKNMEMAYEDAAKLSKVPLVKINGNKAMVSTVKHGITGYPTIFGISSLGGGPSRYASARTTEGFLEFTRLLVPQ